MAGLMDRPDGVRKTHDRETPLVGGLALLLPAFSISLVYFANFKSAPFVELAVLGSALMLAIGAMDDRLGLSPVWRLVAMTFIIFSLFLFEPLFILHALKFSFHGYKLTIPLSIFAAPVTAFFILGFVNAANMADGMNGQLIGSVIVWSFFIALHLDAGSAIPFYIVICSALVTLSFNLRGDLFAGSSGAYAASLFVALGAIAAYRLNEGGLPAQFPLLWFWLPVQDCIRLMARRAYLGRSPFSGDRDHFHHKLMERLRPRDALIVYLALLAAPGIAIEFDWYLCLATILVSQSIYWFVISSSFHATSLNRGAIPRPAPQGPRPYWRTAFALAEREVSSTAPADKQETA